MPDGRAVLSAVAELLVKWHELQQFCMYYLF